MLLMASCSEDIGGNLSPENGEAVEISSVSARIGTVSTRASATGIYIGRDEFTAGDKMTLTDIRRSSQPIDAFNYKDITFNCGSSGAWERDLDTGFTLAKPEEHPERIYWSDAHSEHTFIGYCLPQQSEGEEFDWKTYTDTGTKATVYYGSLGIPAATAATREGGGQPAYIDYTTGNDALKKEDVVFAYHADMVSTSGGSEALVTFRHGLANVTVVVNISGFTGAPADTKTRVTDMTLCNMHTMYKWDKKSSDAQPLTDADQAALNALYAESGITYDQKKDIRMWLTEAEGTDVGSNRRFIFHGIVVPETIGETEADGLTMQFTVRYPNPIRPSQDVTHTYTATMPGAVTFHAGKTTTININLNHKDEVITIGAEYNDWEFTDTPDQGSLKKKSTFLSYNSKAEGKITTHNDPGATIDDATWLYTRADGTVVDIYGHSGNSADDPYTITCAEELLSFAYEVKEGFSETIRGYGSSTTEHVNFKDKHVKLDADITMQRSVTADDVTWVGIGDAGHPFDGQFDGGTRAVSYLRGNAFFYALGEHGHVTQLRIGSTAGEGVTGSGGIAETNAGAICSSAFNGTISHTGGAEYTGGIAGKNTGSIFCCRHVGDITAGKHAGGIAGLNSGRIIASYSAGAQTVEEGGSTNGIAAMSGTNAEVVSCYYDNTLLSPSSAADGASGLPTTFMQRYAFVGPKPADVKDVSEYDNYQQSMNYALYQWINKSENINDAAYHEHIKDMYYYYQPAAYPKVY